MKVSYFISALFFIYQSAFAATCPPDFVEDLHAQLKSNIPAITWLDINLKPEAHGCQFHIRFYPCTASTKVELGILLPVAISTVNKQCSLIDKGRCEHEQGYCVLKNVGVGCEAS